MVKSDLTLAEAVEMAAMYKTRIIPDAEEELSRVRGELEMLETATIPALLADAGQQSATMSDGTKVAMKEFLTAKILDQRGAVAWLEENGLGDIVKDTIRFPKGEIDSNFIDSLEEAGLHPERESDVHWKTLQAAIRRHIEGGGDWPDEEAISVNRFEKAVVTLPKGE